jgi:hypothetical protein
MWSSLDGPGNLRHHPLYNFHKKRKDQIYVTRKCLFIYLGNILLQSIPFQSKGARINLIIAVDGLSQPVAIFNTTAFIFAIVPVTPVNKIPTFSMLRPTEEINFT